MFDYKIFNTQTDHVRPDHLHGKYHYHLFCKVGSMLFICHGKPVTVRPGDFLIWRDSKGFSDFSYSKDFDADILLISTTLVSKLNPEKTWASIGYQYLKTNPVLHLDLEEMAVLMTDFQQLRNRRIGVPIQFFGEEVADEMLKVLVYDIWNIYSRKIVKSDFDDAKSGHLLFFLLMAQEYCPEHRDVAWYAKKIGLTPKYLTEISKDITGRPAGDWIDNFAAYELRKLLSDGRLTISDIIEQMHFSCHPVFTRYVKRILNTTPSAYQLANQVRSPQLFQ